MMVDGRSWLSSFNPASWLVVECAYFGFLLMVCSFFNSFESLCTLQECSKWFILVYPFHPSNGPLHPLKGCDFYLSNEIFTQFLCSKMLFRSRTIIPRLVKSISFYLIRFWEPWMFNYPLNFILYFTSLNLMDWHGNRVITSFDISWTYVSNSISIRWGNPKLLVCQCRVLSLGINGDEGKWPRMFPNVLIKLVWVSFRLIA